METLQPTSNLQKLHENLSKREGFSVPYEQFELDMKDDMKMKTLHGNLAKSPEFTVPYEQFRSDMFSSAANNNDTQVPKIDAPTTNDVSFGDWAKGSLKGFAGTVVDIATNAASGGAIIPTIKANREVDKMKGSEDFTPEVRKALVESFADYFSATNITDPIATKTRRKGKEIADNINIGSKVYGDKDFTDFYKSGEYGKMVGDIMREGVRSIPYTIGAAFSAPATFGIGGLSGAMDRYDEISDRTDLKQIQKVSNALAIGAIQSASELLFDIPMVKWLKGIYSKAGKEVAEKAVINGFLSWMNGMFKKYGLLLAPVGEGTEEVAGAFGNAVTDIITDVDPDAMQKFPENAMMGFVYGAGGGLQGSMAALPGVIANKVNNYKEKKQARANIEANLSPITNAKTGNVHAVKLRGQEKAEDEVYFVVDVDDDGFANIVDRQGNKVLDSEGKPYQNIEDFTTENVISREQILQGELQSLTQEQAAKEQTEAQTEREKNELAQIPEQLTIPNENGKEQKYVFAGEVRRNNPEKPNEITDFEVGLVDEFGEMPYDIAFLPAKTIYDYIGSQNESNEKELDQVLADAEKEVSAENSDQNGQNVTTTPSGDNNVSGKEVKTFEIEGKEVKYTKNEDHFEIVPTEKMPLNKAAIILQKKYKDSKKYEVEVIEKEVTTPEQIIPAEHELEEDQIIPATTKIVTESVKILPKGTLEQRRKEEQESKSFYQEQKKAVLVDAVSKFNATPDSRSDKQKASEIEALATKLGYMTDRSPMNEIRIFNNKEGYVNIPLPIQSQQEPVVKENFITEIKQPQQLPDTNVGESIEAKKADIEKRWREEINNLFSKTQASTDKQLNTPVQKLSKEEVSKNIETAKQQNKDLIEELENPEFLNDEKRNDEWDKKADEFSYKLPQGVSFRITDGKVDFFDNQSYREKGFGKNIVQVSVSNLHNKTEKFEVGDNLQVQDGVRAMPAIVTKVNEHGKILEAKVEDGRIIISRGNIITLAPINDRLKINAKYEAELAALDNVDSSVDNVDSSQATTVVDQAAAETNTKLTEEQANEKLVEINSRKSSTEEKFKFLESLPKGSIIQSSPDTRLVLGEKEISSGGRETFSLIPQLFNDETGEWEDNPSALQLIFKDKNGEYNKTGDFTEDFKASPYTDIKTGERKIDQPKITFPNPIEFKNNETVEQPLVDTAVSAKPKAQKPPTPKQIERAKLLKSEPNSAREVILKYFLSGGKVSPEMINRESIGRDRTGKLRSEGERRSMFWVTKQGEANYTDQLEHILHGTPWENMLDDPTDFSNEVLDVLSLGTPSNMMAELKRLQSEQGSFDQQYSPEQISEIETWAAQQAESERLDYEEQLQSVFEELFENQNISEQEIVNLFYTNNEENDNDQNEGRSGQASPENSTTTRDNPIGSIEASRGNDEGEERQDAEVKSDLSLKQKKQLVISRYGGMYEDVANATPEEIYNTIPEIDYADAKQIHAEVKAEFEQELKKQSTSEYNTSEKSTEIKQEESVNKEDNNILEIESYPKNNTSVNQNIDFFTDIQENIPTNDKIKTLEDKLVRQKKLREQKVKNMNERNGLFGDAQADPRQIDLFTETFAPTQENFQAAIDKIDDEIAGIQRELDIERKRQITAEKENAGQLNITPSGTDIQKLVKNKRTGKETEKEIPTSPDGKYQIYEYKVKNNDDGVDLFYGVPSVENKGIKGFGDDLFKTIEEAVNQVKYNRTEGEKLLLEKQKEKEEREFQRQQEEAAKQAKAEANKGKSKLELMNEAKNEKALNKQLNYEGNIKTRKQFIEDSLREGKKFEIGQENKIKDVTRSAYNRMNGREQEEFDKRQKEAGLKNVYKVVDTDGSYYEITKAEYDYAIKLQQQAQPVVKENLSTEPTDIFEQLQDVANKRKAEKENQGQKSIEQNNQLQPIDIAQIIAMHPDQINEYSQMQLISVLYDMTNKENKINDPYEKITDDSQWLYNYIFFDGLTRENQLIYKKENVSQRLSETPVNTEGATQTSETLLQKNENKQSESEPNFRVQDKSEAQQTIEYLQSIDKSKRNVIYLGKSDIIQYLEDNRRKYSRNTIDQVKNANFSAFYLRDEIFINSDKVKTKEDVDTNWIHERVHAQTKETLNNEELSLLYDQIGFREIQRIIPHLYWLETPNIQADEYISFASEKLLANGKLDDKIPSDIQNIILNIVNNITSINNLTNGKNNLDNFQQGIEGRNAYVGDSDRRGTKQDRTDSEGNGVGSGTRLQPDEKGSKVTFSDQANIDLKDRHNVIASITKIGTELNIPVNVVNSSELTSDNGQIALTDNGTVTIVSDRVKSVSEVIKALVKEVAGEKGIREILANADPNSIVGKQLAKYDELSPEELQSDKLAQVIRKAFRFTSGQFSQSDLFNIINEQRGRMTDGQKTNIETSETNIENDRTTVNEPKNTYKTKEGQEIQYTLTFGDNNKSTTNDLQQDENRQQNPSLRRLKEGEMASVEMKYTLDKNYIFDGRNKIESAEDIAYLFRQLENKSVENMFACLVDENQKPTIIHISMGGRAGTVIDFGVLADAVSRFSPKKVYLIHNHPSGNLVASDADIQIHTKAKDAFGEDLIGEHVIINTTSGKYASFNHKYDYDTNSRPKTVETPQNYKVLKFDKQVFKDTTEPFKVTGSKSVAKFISAQRFSSGDKLSVLILARNNDIKAYLHLPSVDFSSKESVLGLKTELQAYAGRFGGHSLILSGNTFDIKDPNESRQNIRHLKTLLKSSDISLLDLVEVESDLKWVSMADEDLMETKEGYGEARFKLIGNPRKYFPKVRGGWTKDKIIRELKEIKKSGLNYGKFSLLKGIASYENAQNLRDHLFYHGTGSGISGGLYPSITMSERDAERYGGGGYGQRYFAVSVSKSKAKASMFSGMSRSVSVYPVLLNQEAKVIDRPDIQDSAELEDEIEQLWDNGVDAVRLGNWDDPMSEQELAVLNPNAISTWSDSQSEQVFGGSVKNFKEKTDKELEQIIDQSKEAIIKMAQWSEENKLNLGDFPEWVDGMTSEQLAERKQSMAERKRIREEYQRLKEQQQREVSKDIRFRILGETGASNLDKAEEVTTRLDNLAVAREMETSGKDAKSIRLATGWEKGVDGKWRYEVADVKLLGQALKDTKDGYGSSFEAKLSQVINDDKLFQSYPELKTIKVEFKSGKTEGSYNDSEKKITVSSGAEDKLSVLLHEIQHAIQDIEGFARGGNQEMFSKSRNNISRLFKDITTVFDQLGYEKWILDGGEVDNTPNRNFNGMYSFAETQNESKKNKMISKLNEANKVINENKSIFGKYNIYENIKDQELYRRLAGETEARNVQTRMNMSPEERRSALLSETEDVAREDQIVLMDGLGVSNLEDLSLGEKPMTENKAKTFQEIFQERYLAIQDLKSNGVKRLQINSDATVTVYHGTSKSNWDKIQKEGFSRQSYFSVHKSGTQYGDSPLDVAKRKFGNDGIVVEVKIDPRHLSSSAAGSELYAENALIPKDDHFEEQQSKPANTILINGVSRPTTNSKGQPIADSEEKIRNFYDWFGDSKVVDEQGRPLVVYHGTVLDKGQEPFSEFNIGELGIHFGNLEQANKRANRFAFIKSIDHGIKPHMIESYLKIENPIYSWSDTRDWSEGFELERVLHKSGSISDSEANSIGWNMDQDYIRQELIDLGYDGIKYKNSFEGDGNSYIVFSNDQIKSATDNIGTFDRNNPDILLRKVSPIGFYSTVENALEQIKQEKGSIDQFKAMLLKNGAKQAELDRMGWDEFVKNKKQKITEDATPLKNGQGYFLRFTNNWDADLDRGTSVHVGNDFGTADDAAELFGTDVENVVWSDEHGAWLHVLPGLAGYELKAETLEEAIEEVNKSNKQFAFVGTPVIYKGRYDMETSDLMPDGDGFKPHSIAKVLVEERPNIITKADIQNWIDQNKIEVEEVVKDSIPVTDKMIESVSQGVPLFRNEYDTPIEAAERVVKAMNQRAEMVRGVADRLSNELNTPIIVVRNETMLPLNLQRQVKKQGAKRSVMGVFNPTDGKIYLVSNNIPSELEAEKTILHEIVGHKGLRGLLGAKEHRNLMQHVWDSLTPAQKADLKNRLGNLDPLVLADEYMAEMAEQNSTPKWYDKVLAKLREMLRKVFPNLRLNNAELKTIIRKSYEALKRPSPEQFDNPLDFAEALSKYAKNTNESAALFRRAPQQKEEGSDLDIENKSIDKKKQRIQDKIEQTPNESETHKKRTILKQKIKDLESGWKSGEVDTKAMIWKVQTDVIEYAKKNMPFDKAGKSEINSLLRLVRYANNPKHLETVLEKIDTIVSGLDVKLKLNNIDKILHDNIAKNVNGKPQGTLDPEVYLMLDKIRAIRKLKGEDEIDQYVDSLNDDDIEGTTLFSVFGNLEEKSRDEINDALDKLISIVSTGKVWYHDQLQKRKKINDGLRGMVLDKVSGGQGLVSELDLISSNSQVKTGAIGRFINAHINFEWLLDKISKDKSEETGKGKMQEYFGDVVTKATNDESKGIREQTDFIHKKATEIFGVDGSKLAKKFHDNTKVIKKSGVTYINREGKRVEIPLSQNQAYKKWMEWQDQSLSKTFKTMGWDETTRKELDKFIFPDVKEWAEWQLKEYYPGYYEGINQKYNEAYFANLGRNENYSPIRREVVSPSNVEDAMMQKPNVLASVGNQSLKTRKSNINNLLLVDGDSMLAQHIAQMEHFKAWVMPINQLRSVFSSREVQKAIKNNHGVSVLSNLNNQIADMARGGEERANIIDFVDKIRRNFVTAELGANISLFPKQSVSLLAYLSEVPVKNYVTGMLDLALHLRKAIGIIKSNEMVTERFQKGWAPEIRAAMKQDTPGALSQSRNILGNLRNILLFPTKMGDYTAVLGGWVVYKYHYDNQITKGKNEQEAHEYALNQVDRSVSRTQQSGALKDVSQIQKGSWNKVLTMFKSSPIQQFRYENAAFRNLINGRGSVAQNAKIIALYHIVMPVMFQLISNLFTDDDDEKERNRLLRAGVLGSFNSLMVVGDIVESVLEKIMGESWGDYSATPLEGSVTKGLQGVGNISSGVKDLDKDKILKGVDQLIYGINNIGIGLPYRPVKKLIKQGDDILHPENVKLRKAEEEYKKIKKEVDDWTKARNKAKNEKDFATYRKLSHDDYMFKKYTSIYGMEDFVYGSEDKKRNLKKMYSQDKISEAEYIKKLTAIYESELKTK